MRWIPERDEALALAAVWLIWPALHFTAWAVLPVLEQLGVTLPGPTRFAFVVLQANRLCVPSLVGTGVVVLVGRLTPSAEAKRFSLHLITLLAFAFTVVMMLAFLTVVRAVT